MSVPEPDQQQLLQQLAALSAQGKHMQVATACDQLIRQGKGSPALLLLLVRSLRAGGRPADALGLLETLPPEMRASWEFLSEHARCLVAVDRRADASSKYIEALAASATDGDLWREVGQAVLSGGDEAGLVAMTELLDRAGAARPVALASLATIQLSLARDADAQSYLEQALALDPECIEALYARAAAHRNRGDFDAAEADYERILQLAPRRLDVLTDIAGLRRYADPADPMLQRLRDAIEQGQPGHGIRERLHYALAKVLDDMGRWEEAFVAADEANELRRRWQRGWNGDAERQRAALLRETFADAASLGPVPEGAGGPLLIVGLPRSGTSLIEQILCSHPEVGGAGETVLLPAHFLSNPLTAETLAARCEPDALASLQHAYPQALRSKGGEHRWVSDKYPANFLLIGLFLKAFPEGRVIHCRRDLRDVAVSLYFQDFPIGNPYANSLEDIAGYSEVYVAQMRHWESLGDPRLISVDYESLVADPEPEVRRMLEHLDLAWDPACIGFQDSRRAVATLSVWQVRQPLYGRAVRRWEHYADQLGPIALRLAVAQGT